MLLIKPAKKTAIYFVKCSRHLAEQDDFNKKKFSFG